MNFSYTINVGCYWHYLYFHNFCHSGVNWYKVFSRMLRNPDFDRCWTIILQAIKDWDILFAVCVFISQEARWDSFLTNLRWISPLDNCQRNSIDRFEKWSRFNVYIIYFLCKCCLHVGKMKLQKLFPKISIRY